MSNKGSKIRKEKRKEGALKRAEAYAKLSIDEKLLRAGTKEKAKLLLKKAATNETPL